MRILECLFRFCFLGFFFRHPRSQRVYEPNYDAVDDSVENSGDEHACTDSEHKVGGFGSDYGIVDHFSRRQTWIAKGYDEEYQEGYDEDNCSFQEFTSQQLATLE